MTRSLGHFFAAAGILVFGGAASYADDVQFQALAPPPPSAHLLPPPGPDEVQFVIDDDSLDGSVGLTSAGNARQFLWFNQFDAPVAGFDLEEIWVLFPPSSGVTVGDAVQLAVYHDDDGDPSNGADLLGAVDETVQAIDGTTFSIYTLGTPIAVPPGGEVLLGVVNRFVVDGVSPTSFAAALDNSSSAGRSWIATWSGAAADPPALPSDGIVTVVETFPGLTGNWMIRGRGTLAPAPVAAVPVLDLPALLALATVLAFVGLWRLRLRPEVPTP